MYRYHGARTEQLCEKSTVARELKSCPQDSLVIFDGSTFGRRASFSKKDEPDDAEYPPRFYVERVLNAISWVAKMAKYVIISFDNERNYPDYRREGTCESRKKKRKPGYQIIDEVADRPVVGNHFEEMPFNLERLLNTQGGREHFMRKLAKYIPFPAIFIEAEDRPPMVALDAALPPYLSLEQNVGQLWHETHPGAHFSENDTRIPALARTHTAAFPGALCVTAGLDGDYLPSILFHPHERIHHFWPSGETIVFFRMARVFKLLGGGDPAQMRTRVFMLYLAGNDFLPDGTKFLGITDKAIVTVALDTRAVPIMITDSWEIDLSGTRDFLTALSKISIQYPDNDKVRHKSTVRSKPLTDAEKAQNVRVLRSAYRFVEYLSLSPFSGNDQVFESFYLE